MRRRNKQLLIGFLYFLLLLLVAVGGYFWFFYQAPVCTDGVQNQNETGIDCGGVCSQYCLADLASRPLVVTEVEALAYTSTASDAIGTISNKNGKAALKNATYTFTVYDQSGAAIAKEAGKISLLPLETRTVAALGLPIAREKIIRTELTVTNEEWVAFTDYTEPPVISVVRQQFSLLSGQAGFAEARGLVQNKSPYDVRSLTVVVVVRDASRQALSVNKTTLNTLQSGEERDFRLVWPSSFTGVPVGADMQIHFDMLMEDAFVKQYFPGGAFQSLDPGN